MRYESITGLDAVQLTEIVERVFHVVGRVPGNARLGLYHQVELVLSSARQNVSQMVAGDLLGVSEPTVSPIWRRLSVLGQVLYMSGLSLGRPSPTVACTALPT